MWQLIENYLTNILETSLIQITGSRCIGRLDLSTGQLPSFLNLRVEVEVKCAIGTPALPM